MKSILIFTGVLLSLVSCSSNNKLSYNANLDSFVYPHKVEKIELSTQNQKLKMAYMYLTKEGATKTAVLLHGKNFSGYYWEDVAQLMLEKGYNVVIPDQIGFGKSDKPKNYQYSFANLALNTKTLLDHLGIKEITLVGHSMGGMLATRFTKIYPKTVKHLVLINPIGLEDYLRYTQFKDTDFFYKSELSKTPEKIREYQKKNYYDGKWSPKYEELIQTSIGQLNGGDWDLVAWNNALTYGPIFSEPVVDDFRIINNPVTLILGTRDRTGPGRGFMKKGEKYQLGQYQNLGKKIIKLLKNGKYIELKGLGHMPQIEDFERFKKVFLKAI
ncbi:alpha/beta fold hydrolase [Bacteriovorax sp. Seq25_V]|uniref:alpha/beta fold hydrolase n=1 Tax=Bacteriovorax sp. Seq25_V TaxID=1201288 RepID=UPI000389FF00|nr:alpha/beta hydrolase [Bacteriovorax sp. Seq25_V]EQC43752.1 putative lysophospholipase [Bacteriovorax sp. Seq25_V]